MPPRACTGPVFIAHFGEWERLPTWSGFRLATSTRELHVASSLPATVLREGRLLYDSTEEPSAAVVLSQPAAEKSAKALLASHNVVFRKTHDLDELGKQCAALAPSLTPLLTEAVGLTDYASNFRYLDAPSEPDEAP